MSAALKQLSCVMGTALALLVLVVALLRGTPVGDAFFRAAVVMCVGSAIVAVFFRFCASVLHSFLQEKFEEQRQAVTKRQEGTARKNSPVRPA